MIQGCKRPREKATREVVRGRGLRCLAPTEQVVLWRSMEKPRPDNASAGYGTPGSTHVKNSKPRTQTCVGVSGDGDHASEIVAKEHRDDLGSSGTAFTQGNVEAGSACAWLCQEARVASITSIMQHSRRSPRRAHVLVWQA